ncbi:MAG: Lrp/AsnC family transcriptional regulator [Epsilonproteobacteria bacterium]|nr:MAG: Lrp/AsnC family transcriptional regulator [Campylobacterota bacterium]
MTKEILLRVQKNFPLTAKPFEAIAKELNMEENEVISIIQQQKDEKIIRQTSAIFDTKSLGYKSSLVAFEIDEDKIDTAVEIINAHPGVSHNYERNHKFNIWFTMAVSPETKIGLDKTIEILAKLTNANAFIMLPTLKLFKISVKLDTTGKGDKKEKIVKKEKIEIEMTPLHMDVIKLLQNDITIKSEPFEDIIKTLNITYQEFFKIVDELQQSGMMRRFASILNHRKAGFNANAMVVWDVDEKDGETIGKTAAEFSAVSHCYLRPKYDNWQYNLFTMIHGKTKDETDAVIADIEKEIESKSHMPLYSSREFKKIRLKYFTDDEKQWENKYIKLEGEL